MRIQMQYLETSLAFQKLIRVGSRDSGSYRIDDHRRLRRAAHMRLRCFHTQSMDVYEDRPKVIPLRPA